MNEQDLPSVRVGDLLAGKYRVERVLGVGGMGIVVAARHIDLQELRAIKLMLGNFAVHPDAVERFLREARAAVRLKSEHVAKVHDVGRLENGAPYMVMEHLEGCDLQQLLKSQGPLPLGIAVTYVLQACEAIGEAPAAGIVHRDIKPANLFLTKSADGSPSTKVLDFGISKFTPPAGSAPALDMTKTSAALGSPLYMSPEQMASTRDVDLRTDIWALGVVLYQLTTGVVPFSAESLTQLCAMVLQQEPRRPSEVRPGLTPEFDRIVMRCLQKIPAHRYANIAELAVDLLPFGTEGARTSVERIGRMLGISTVRLSVHSSPSLATSSQTASASIVPQGTDRPVVVQSVVMGAGTSAGWGQTGSARRKTTPVVRIVLTAIMGLIVLLIGVGVLSRRGASTTALSAPEASSVLPSTTVHAPIDLAGIPTPSGALASSSAQASPPGSVPAAIASTKAAVAKAGAASSTGPAKASGGVAPRSAQTATKAAVNPFGDERK